MSKRSDLDQDCRDKVCPPGAESRLSSFRTSADLSTVFFVVGGVAAVAGVTLLVFAPQRRTTMAWSVGPRGASLQGTF
ncbi:MAG: hypothetical protein HOO96_35445 [Polyangiaceae bacterium]|nr:hypothetical protein [Polyangiaceae bacterium]